MNSPNIYKTSDNKRKDKGKRKPRQLQSAKARLQHVKNKYNVSITRP